jgi:hypothetical protein
VLNALHTQHVARIFLCFGVPVAGGGGDYQTLSQHG